MKEVIQSVDEFMKAFGQSKGSKPRLLSDSSAKLRYKLMREENEEYLEACDNGNLVEIADALGDQLYILAGTILAHGMQDIITDVFNEIHASNMSKLGEDGNPIYREDGKVLKGPNYFQPDLTKFLN